MVRLVSLLKLDDRFNHTEAFDSLTLRPLILSVGVAYNPPCPMTGRRRNPTRTLASICAYAALAAAAVRLQIPRAVTLACALIVSNGSAAQRREFIDAAIEAVNRCLPLEFSPLIIDGVPGRVFSMEFRSDGFCLEQCTYERALLS